MKAIRTEAIVLRRTNYGEADRIVQLLTPDHGKLSVMARGVRKERSKLAGGIELFAVSEVTVHKGRGEIDILTGARLDAFFPHVLDSYEKMQFGYEVLKLTGNAVAMAPEPEWYGLAKIVLVALNTPLIELAIIEMWFRLQYAALLGQGLNVVTDTAGAKLTAGQKYSYDVAEMGLRPYDQGDITAEHIKLLRIATVKPPEIIAKIGGVSEILPVCLWVVRQHARIG
jgi:DNA repair protein RecO (recombination protein O)